MVHKTIILHDGQTEVVRKFYLAENLMDCVLPSLGFSPPDSPKFSAPMTRTQTIEECAEKCQTHPLCVMFVYVASIKGCHLRGDREATNAVPTFQAGFKYCGTLYYEGLKSQGSATFAKGLERVSFASGDESFKVVGCEGRKLSSTKTEDCYLLVQV